MKASKARRSETTVLRKWGWAHEALAYYVIEAKGVSHAVCSVM